LDLATPSVTATAFTGKRPEAAMASATLVFWASGFQGVTQDLGFHALAAEKAFEFADAAQGNDLLIGPDGFLPTLAHAEPPLKQQAWGDAIKPGNG
jgi:uncharacterized protein (DUF2237 family)